MRNLMTKLMTLGLLVVVMGSAGCEEAAEALINPEQSAVDVLQVEPQRQDQWNLIWMGGW